MFRLFSLLCSLLLVVFCFSCSSRSQTLQDSVERYAKALRRGDPDLAIAFVNPDMRAAVSKTFERIDKDLLISQVEVKSIVPDEKLENAVVIFLLEYYDHSSSALMINKTTSLWKYDKSKKAWLMNSTTPFILK